MIELDFQIVYRAPLLSYTHSTMSMIPPCRDVSHAFVLHVVKRIRLHVACLQADRRTRMVIRVIHRPFRMTSTACNRRPVMRIVCLHVLRVHL